MRRDDAEARPLPGIPLAFVTGSRWPNQHVVILPGLNRDCVLRESDRYDDARNLGPHGSRRAARAALLTMRVLGTIWLLDRASSGALVLRSPPQVGVSKDGGSRAASSSAGQMRLLRVVTERGWTQRDTRKPVGTSKTRLERCPRRVLSVQQFTKPGSAELVHRVMRAAGLQRGLAGKIFLVVVADVGAGHVLVPDAGDALAELGALDVLD